MEFDADTPPVRGLAAPAVALVTGASRGIGREIAGQLLRNRHVARVFALSRAATRDESLAALRRLHGERLHCVDVDLAGDLEPVVHALRDVHALHLVVNAAGLLHDATVAPEKAVEQLERDSLARVFALNAFAPVLLARALMPQLCRHQPAVYASLSARVGSIGDNRAGGWYAYRASKAAQNQLLKTFSIEWRRRNPAATCLLLHPGTVDTALSAPFQARVPAGRLMRAGEAAGHLLRIVSTATPADTGRFIAWDGRDVPW